MKNDIITFLSIREVVLYGDRELLFAKFTLNAQKKMRF